MNRKELVIVAIFTSIVIIIWIISDIVHTQSSVKISDDVQTAVTPLDPNFDQQTLDKIKKLDSSNPPPTTIINPTPSPTAQPSPTTSPSDELPTVEDENQIDNLINDLNQ